MKSRKAGSLVTAFLLFFILLSTSWGQTSVSSYLNTSGYINYPTPTPTPTPTPSPSPPPNGEGLVYSTDFEGVTVVDANHLSLATSHWVEARNGGSFWIEDSGSPSGPDAPTPRSGVNCLGQQAPNAYGSSLRSEFEIKSLDDLVGDELFVVTHLYFPSDWELHGSSWNWYELINTFVTDQQGFFYPRTCVHITKYNGVYSLVFKYYYAIGNYDVIGEIPNFVVPVGEWFTVKYYVKRGALSTLRLWISTSHYGEDYSVGELVDQPTASSDLDWFTVPAKTYLDGDGYYHKVWCDDLEIWDRSLL